MSRSFLARFRGADARSIAHALAILLVVNAVFGAFHFGTMAKAGTGEIVLCSSEGAIRLADGLPREPAAPAEMSCCGLGFGPSPAALAAEPAPLVDRTVISRKHSGSASPRGPPILA